MKEEVEEKRKEARARGELSYASRREDARFYYLYIHVYSYVYMYRDAVLLWPRSNGNHGHL